MVHQRGADIFALTFQNQLCVLVVVLHPDGDVVGPDHVDHQLQVLQPVQRFRHSLPHHRLQLPAHVQAYRFFQQIQDALLSVDLDFLHHALVMQLSAGIRPRCLQLSPFVNFLKNLISTGQCGFVKYLLERLVVCHQGAPRLT